MVFEIRFMLICGTKMNVLRGLKGKRKTGGVYHTLKRASDQLKGLTKEINVHILERSSTTPKKKLPLSSIRNMST